jgi:hypothetical protein
VHIYQDGLNGPPAVAASPNQTISQNETVLLTATASDDGYPLPSNLT